MASLTRSHGATIVSAGTPVEFYGRQVQFVAVVVKNNGGSAVDLTGEFAADYAVDLINQAITMAGASILFVQYDATGQLSYGLDGSQGNWTYTSLQTAIRALGATVGPTPVDVRGTVVTDVGFKLATS